MPTQVFASVGRVTASWTFKASSPRRLRGYRSAAQLLLGILRWTNQFCVAVFSGKATVNDVIAHHFEVTRRELRGDARAIRSQLEKRHAMFGVGIVRQREWPAC